MVVIFVIFLMDEIKSSCISARGIYIRDHTALEIKEMGAVAAMLTWEQLSACQVPSFWLSHPPSVL